MTLAHGDDYVSSGMTSDLDWMQKELERKYDLKTPRTREGVEAETEANILNTIVRRTTNGYELEADTRHA